MAWVKKGGPRIPFVSSPLPKPRNVAALATKNDNKENESKVTAASVFDKKFKKAQMLKTYPCPHLYCSCTFTTASDNYTHFCQVHHHAAETLLQRAKDGQIAGPYGWVDLS